MKKLIPLHSLVICLQDEYHGLHVPIDYVEKNLANAFEKHETISFSDIANDLVGNNYRLELETIIRNETFRRIALKLSLGERVVVHGSNGFTRDQIMALTKLAKYQGSSVFYYVQNGKAFVNDGMAEVISEATPIEPVKYYPLEEIHKKFNGLTVVGDVHGDIVCLMKAIEWARSKNNYLVFLGDMIDYGPDPIEAMNVIHNVVMNGLGTTLIGNHERKIARWLHFKEENTKIRMRISDGNKVTIDALDNMDTIDKTIWIGKFKSVIARSSLILSIKNFTFTHAAIHPDYWKGVDNPEIENYALYGEPDPNFYPDFKLAHSWLNYVPNGEIVIVGHESHSQLYPLTVTCQNGGKVVFLDTGCGKGGPLSTADIAFGGENDFLSLGNFNRHAGHAGRVKLKVP